MMLLIIIALLAIGMVLCFAEVALLPGFGAAGIGSILCLAGGVGLAWTQYGAPWGMGALLLAGAAAIAIVVIAPRTKAGKDLVLQTAITEQQAGDDYALLRGRAGLSITPLRPSGAAEIEGRRVDVVTDGVFIDAGQSIEVVSVEGTRVVVTAARDAATT